MSSELTLSEVARRVDVSPATLRRWVRDGIVPLGDGRWTPAAVAHARIVARLRERGYPLGALREAVEEGRLAYGYPEDLFPQPARTRTLAEAADECGLEPELIQRIWTAAGFASESLDRIADAEVKLFHLYVHEPLMRDGVPGLEIAEAMEGLAAELLPLASPIMDRVHQRMLQHFVDQESSATSSSRAPGEEEALDVVERFVESVEDTLPEEARVIKTIGDEVTWRRGSARGEVLVTRPVVEAADGHLAFEPIGQVKLKGFTAATDLFLARPRP